MKRKSIMATVTTIAVLVGTIGTMVPASAEEKEQLVIMHQWTDEVMEQGNAEGQAVQHAIENFQEKHPDVEVVIESLTQEAGYESKIKTLAAADELPDVFFALPSMMTSFYKNGQVLDLKPILEEDTEWYETFADGAFGDFTYGDAILGAPRCAIANSVLFYNKAIFEECGINEFPSTMDEFLEAVKTLRENGYIPLATGNKDQFAIASQVMPGILFKFVDASWYEKLRNYDGASFEDEDALAAISFMNELMQAGMFNEDANSCDIYQAREYYYSGKAAMYLEGSWVVSSFITDCQADTLENTEITLFPVVEGKEELDGQMVTGQGWGFSINSQISEEKQALAVDFLKELTSEEVQAECVENGLLTVLKEVSYDESKLDPFYVKFLDLYAAKSAKVGCPEVQLSTAYMDASYTGYQELSVGTVTPEELAASLQEAHESAQ